MCRQYLDVCPLCKSYTVAVPRCVRLQDRAETPPPRGRRQQQRPAGAARGRPTHRDVFLGTSDTDDTAVESSAAYDSEQTGYSSSSGAHDSDSSSDTEPVAAGDTAWARWEHLVERINCRRFESCNEARLALCESCVGEMKRISWEFVEGMRVETWVIERTEDFVVRGEICVGSGFGGPVGALEGPVNRE